MKSAGKAKAKKYDVTAKLVNSGTWYVYCEYTMYLLSSPAEADSIYLLVVYKDDSDTEHILTESAGGNGWNMIMRSASEIAGNLANLKHVQKK